MRPFVFRIALLTSALAVAAPAAAADTGAALHRAAAASPAAAPVAPSVSTIPVAVPTVSSLSEGFDDITQLAGRGWYMQNNSSPIGTIGWFQGNPTTATPTPGPFNAYDGANNAYIAANFNNASSTSPGTISNWLLTPELDFGGNAQLTFYTRKPAIAAGNPEYPDRLEVRYSTAGPDTNVGAGATAVGVFTNHVLTVNPNLVVGGYPQAWTQYTVSGLPRNGRGRVAFRYFVTNAGSAGTNSDFIGIDRVVYSTGAPEYRVGGNVSGLAGSGLVLRLNGGNDLPVAANGSFQFPAYIPSGGAYAVTVASQPVSTPQRTCAVSNDSGLIGSGDVTNVQVTCTVNQYAVGGSVSGLSGSGLTLQLNGGSPLPVSANGAFAFPPITDGSAYSVTVATQPTGPAQICTVANGAGTLAGADVSNVAVTCVDALAQVSASIADGRDYARYSQVVDYTVRLSNGGNGVASGIALSSVLSAGLNDAQARWICLDGGNGAVCAPTGTGPLIDTVTLPAGGSLTWLVTIPVRAVTSEPAVTYQVHVDGAVQASDSNTLVVMRDGFDVDGADGTSGDGSPPPMLQGAAATALLDGESSHVFALPPASVAGRVERVPVLRDGAREVGVDRFSLGARSYVRLRVAAPDAEQVSPWSAVEAGAALAIASVKTGDGLGFLLEGAAEPLQVAPGR